MFKVFKSKFLIFLVFTSFFLNAKELEKVSLQLQWLDQFQFAGYYMAKEKGFYKDVGLDVELKKFDTNIIPVDEVVSNRANYAVGRSSLLVEKSNGKSIRLLAAIFQESPLIIMTLPTSNIKTLEDLKGKTLMISSDTSTDVSINAMVSSKRLNMDDIKKIPHNFKIDDLINKKVDAITAYSTNQLYLLEEKGIKPNVFNPKDYGFDFYNDILFTSDEEYEQHPKRVENFTNASLKGWQYALDNIEESVDIIYKKYNPQHLSKNALVYEALKTKELVLKQGYELGEIDLNKLDRIYNVYNLMGLIPNKYDLNNFVLKFRKDEINYTKEELDYIKNTSALKYSEINWKPLSIIENNKMKGIMGEYLDLVTKKTGLKFEYVQSNSWSEVLEKFKNKKIDLVPGICSSESEKKLGLMSNIYATYPMVIVTNEKYKYIDNMKELEGRKIAVPKDYTSYFYLKNNYPKIDIIATKTIEDALLLVSNDEADAFVGHIATTLFAISEKYLNTLKVSGLTDFKFEHHYLIQNDNHILLSIINKAFASITPQEINSINEKWVKTKIEQKSDYKNILLITGIFVFLLLAIISRHQVLRKYNQRLENSYGELENILDSTLEAIIIVKNNICVDINKSAKKLLKIETKNQIIQRNICEFFDSKSFLMYEQNIIDDRNNIFEINIIKQDKEIFPALLKNTRIKYKDDDVNLISLIDLSGIKEKEKLLVEQSKMAALGEMIGNIAHQWRQPLSVISTIASTYKVKYEFGQEVVNDDFIKEMDQINSSAQYLSKTIDDFKNFIKKDVSKTKENVNEVVRHTVSIEESLIKNNQINLIFNIDEKIYIKCFKNELMQGLINIINNSIDAMKNIGEDNRYIFIDVFEQNKDCIIKIRDSGKGIPNEIIEKVFEPYFTTKHASQGTGLGLYMTYSIIKKLDGDLKVQNKNFTYGDKSLLGAEFTLTLPL